MSVSTLHLHHIQILSRFDRGRGHMYTVELLQSGGSNERPYGSRITLYEDGKPLKSYETHDNIAIIGRGRFSHWGRDLMFATTDNSDPNTNGRSYTYTVGAPTPPSALMDNGQVEMVPPILHEEGLCWFVSIELDGSNMDDPRSSPLEFFENGQPLGPSHSQHADIRAFGAGRYSHWERFIFFSTSDGTDPNVNGRIYSYAQGSASGAAPGIDADGEPASGSPKFEDRPVTPLDRSAFFPDTEDFTRRSGSRGPK